MYQHTIRALALIVAFAAGLLAAAAVPAEAKRPGRPITTPIERIDIRKPAVERALPTTPRRPTPVKRTNQRR